MNLTFEMRRFRTESERLKEEKNGPGFLLPSISFHLFTWTQYRAVERRVEKTRECDGKNFAFLGARGSSNNGIYELINILMPDELMGFGKLPTRGILILTQDQESLGILIIKTISTKGNKKRSRNSRSDQRRKRN